MEADGHLRFAFHATVEDARRGVRANRAHEQELARASAQARAAECDDERVIHLPKCRLRTRLFERGPETAEHVVDRREIAHRLELAEIQDALLELRVLVGSDAAADSHHARPCIVGEQELQHVIANQAGRAGNECGAAQRA